MTEEIIGKVGYDDTALRAELDNKVDKVSGKGLSTNDFTDEEKTKLAGLSNYDDTEVKQSISQEIENRKQADTEIKNSIETTVNSAIAEIVAKSPEDFNTLKEIADWIDDHEDSASAMNTAIQANKAAISSEASTRVNADATLQANIDKKVDKISGKGLSTNDYTTAEKNKLAGLSNSVATTSANGLMSSSDKKKLDEIASGANKITVDSSLSSSSTNPVQNKVVNSALSNKVDKISGKGLSTNDFTDELKEKLKNLDFPFNYYSVSSQGDANRLWIDGKPVYYLFRRFNNLSSTTTAKVLQDFSNIIETIVSFSFIYDDGQYVFNSSFNGSGDTTDRLRVYFDNKQLKYITGSKYPKSGGALNITMEYTSPNDKSAYE